MNLGRQIVKAPDGTYFIWSTVVEDIIIYDAKSEDIIAEYKDEFGRRGEEEARRIIEKLENGEKPYYQFTLTFEKAMEQRTWNKSEKALKEDVEYNLWIDKQWHILNRSN